MTNSITHFEIYGDQPEKLAQFYGSVFGWHIEQTPGVDYWRVETSSPDGLHGEWALLLDYVSRSMPCQ